MIEEWLVREDWCDVFLMCRGGVFNAHRTVLASVSPYLRCILISHSEQHTPIYIALPDFDWEIMSSVLYYVYNGEINVPLGHLSSFFDIINTLKIFIDKAILEKVKEYLKDIKSEDFLINHLDHYKSMEKLSEESEKFVKLHFKTLTCTKFNATNQKSNKNSLLQPQEDEQTYILNSNKIQKQDKDLKNSLLRDPFTEMYSQNGNANRPSPNVPTITNERYLELVSGEVMNGNNNIMDTEPKSEADYTTDTYLMDNYSEKCTKRYNGNHNKDFAIAVNCTKNIKISDNKLESIEAKVKYNDLNKNNNILCFNNTYTTPKNNKCHGWLDLSKDYQINNRTILGKNLSANGINEESKKLKTKKYCRGDNEIKVNLKKKRSPLNKVLASPWIPKQPRSYRPLKNKRRFSFENRNDQILDDCESLSNDKNNNLSLLENSYEINKKTQNISAESKHSQIRESNVNDNEKQKSESEMSSSNEESEDSKKLSSRARHTCGECGKSFSQLRNYKYHLSVHRGTKEFAATCPVCGKYFNDRGYLSSHLKIHRNRKEYQCPHCPKSFNQRVAYNMHIRIHTGVKPHVCEQCGKAFSRKMLLKQHKRTHSGERPYACSFCDKRFADRSNMTLHMRLHSGVKPFACTLCPKTFTKKHHLKTHLNFHTGAKPYSCPRCNMAFSQSSNMRTHLKKCTAEASTT